MELAADLDSTLLGKFDRLHAPEQVPRDPGAALPLLIAPPARFLDTTHELGNAGICDQRPEEAPHPRPSLCKVGSRIL